MIYIKKEGVTMSGLKACTIIFFSCQSLLGSVASFMHAEPQIGQATSHTPKTLNTLYAKLERLKAVQESIERVIGECKQYNETKLIEDFTAKLEHNSYRQKFLLKKISSIELAHSSEEEGKIVNAFIDKITLNIVSQSYPEGE